MVIVFLISCNLRTDFPIFEIFHSSLVYFRKILIHYITVLAD